MTKESLSAREGFIKKDILRPIDWQIIDTIRATGSVTKRHLEEAFNDYEWTIYARLDRLASSGWVIESGRKKRTGRAGPLTKEYQVNPDAGYFLGVQIGLDRVSTRLVDFRFGVVPEYNTGAAFEDQKSALYKDVPQAISSALQTIRDGGKVDKLMGVGFSVPGRSKDNYYYSDYPAARFNYIKPQELMSVNGIPPVFDNRNFTVSMSHGSHCAGIAEKEVGNNGIARTEGHIVYYTVGERVGIGYILDGKLYKGAGGYAGGAEHYYNTIDTDHKACVCGQKDCKMVKLSIPGLVDNWKWRTKTKENVNLDEIYQLAQMKNPQAVQLFREFGKMLGEAATVDLELTNADNLIIGGDIASYYNQFNISTYTSINTTEMNMPLFMHPSRLGHDAEAIGAAINAYRAFQKK